MRLSDTVAHLLRRQAVIAPDHGHNRDVDFWQYIHWGAHHRERCGEQDENCHHNKCVRPF